MFAGRTHSFEDNRRDYGEVRIITIGFLDGRMTVVGWVPRGEDRHAFNMPRLQHEESQ